MTSAELAKATQVSQSAIVKFTKKIGFSGYTEFKMQLGKDSISEEQIISFTHDEISLEDDITDVAKAILSESVSALSRTVENLDQKKLSQCVSIINQADRIFLCGKGSSALPAQDFTNKLLKIGLTAVWNTDFDSTIAATFNSGPNDIFIIFSFSGETKEYIRVAQLAKKNGAKIILVTKNNMSTIAKLCDVVLEIISNETILRTAAMSSRSAFFIIIDILFLAIIKSDLGNRFEKVRDVYQYAINK